MTTVSQLRAAAERAPALEIVHEEPHPAGLVIGLGSVALGVWLSQRAGADAAMSASAGGWLALVGALVGMLMYLGWHTQGAGWCIDFEARRMDPVRNSAAAVVIDGAGWSVCLTAGSGLTHCAIDLVHDERGRVARLLDRAAWRRSDRRHISALADALAKRLGAVRSGPRH